MGPCCLHVVHPSIRCWWKRQPRSWHWLMHLIRGNRFNTVLHILDKGNDVFEYRKTPVLFSFPRDQSSVVTIRILFSESEETFILISG
mmetsp:Transcript_9160/g.17469  ORF Transcript_9160/g.17469 Transcript_9160/m.17469 type:complete len:88 (+) Transcript_9160:75-338(+)